MTVSGGLTYTTEVSSTDARIVYAFFTGGTGTVSWQWGYFP
jgi:hypothetical protein